MAPTIRIAPESPGSDLVVLTGLIANRPPITRLDQNVIYLATDTGAAYLFAVGATAWVTLGTAGGGSGGGPFTVDDVSVPGSTVVTDTASGNSFTITGTDRTEMVSPDTNTYSVATNGQIDWVVNGTPVGQVTVVAGTPKWTLSGILDPSVYAGTPMTTVQRNALTPVTGYLIYNSTTQAYEFYNGSAWVSLTAPPSPATTISPASTDATGAVGVSALYARQDHKHPADPPSSDVGNAATVGTDGLIFVAPGSIPLANAIAPAANDATGAIGVSTDVAREDHKHPAQAPSADANNLIATGSDGLHHVDSAALFANAVSPKSDDTTGAVGVVAQAAREDHKHPAEGVSTDVGNLLSSGTDGRALLAGSFLADAISPAANNATGAIGVETQAAREDHKHPAQAPSADANNAITAGADGLHHLDPANLMATTVSPAATDGTGLVGTGVLAARNDHKHPVQVPSTDANNWITAGTDGRHLVDSSTILATATPAAPSASGAVGIAGRVAREDHVHPTQPVSTDAGNILANGTDGRALYLGEARLFLTETLVAPAIPGSPTDVEIATAAGTTRNTVLYYNGTNVAGLATHAYWIDRAGAVTALKTPTSSITNSLTAAAADTITSTVSGQAATLAPPAGTIDPARLLGFDATGALVKGVDPGKARVFLTNTSVAPASPGAPTLLEIAAAIGSNRDVVAYYNGTDVAGTPDPTHVYHVDSTGAVTLLQSPAAASITPADAISPAATDATGAIGVNTTEFAREDHKHPAQGVSADALNSIVAGTDGLHWAPNEVVENAGALAGAAPTGAQWGIDTTTGATYYVSGGNWTSSPVAADYTDDFVIADWAAAGANKTLTYAAAAHGKGVNPVVQVFETVGAVRSVVAVETDVSVAGDVTLTVPDGIEFDGHIHIS